MRYTVRPLSDRTWLRPAGQRQGSQFSASYSDTLELLARELEHLGARDVAIEVDVPESGIRRDGQGLLASARSESPAVVVAFESKHGPMLYRCDRYVTGVYRAGADSWQHNLRAIALTLQALRAVDRYGATETGQQYQGFKALPAGRAMPASHMTSDEAVSVLASFTDLKASEVRDHDLRWVVRTARGRAHPDRHGGDHTFWNQVEEAARVLGVAR